MLFVMVKAYLCLKINVFFRTFENFVLLIYPYLHLIWAVFKCNKVTLIITHIGCLLNLGSMPLVGLLKWTIAGIGKLGLIGTDLICNKTVYIYIYISLV